MNECQRGEPQKSQPIRIVLRKELNRTQAEIIKQCCIGTKNRLKLQNSLSRK